MREKSPLSAKVPGMIGVLSTDANSLDDKQMAFSFLATEPNAEISAYQLRSMPVLLLTDKDRGTWMKAPTEEALAPQRPAKDGTLKVVGRGNLQDRDDPL